MPASPKNSGTPNSEATVDLLPFEPLATFRPGPLQDDALLADNHGKKIGILILTYNAVGTLTKVLKRITPNVWKNVAEVAIFDDASQDATYELAMGLKTLRQLDKLQVLTHPKNLGYGGNQKGRLPLFHGERLRRRGSSPRRRSNMRRRFCRIFTIPLWPAKRTRFLARA